MVEVRSHQLLQRALARFPSPVGATEAGRFTQLFHKGEAQGAGPGQLTLLLQQCQLLRIDT
jgi:hypothetical protein